MPRKHHKKENARKSRAKHQCSDKLADLIRLANLVANVPKCSFEDIMSNPIAEFSPLYGWFDFFFALPKDIKNFIYFSKEYTEHKKSRSWEYWSRNDGQAQDKLTDLLADEQISEETYNRISDASSDELADFLVEIGIYDDDYTLAAQFEDDSYYYRDDKEEIEQIEKWDRYSLVSAEIKAFDRLHSIRDFLLAIIKLADHIETFSANQEIDASYIYLKQKSFERTASTELTKKKLAERVLATSVSFNEKGEIQFSISEMAKILQGTDVRRIRLCEVCQNIFWANRSDAFACSKKHAKVRQMRLLRDNWRQKGDLYLKARRKKEKRISSETKAKKND